MNNPIVSVVIPTYNRAAKLIQAIDSVLNQTMRDFEILVVDDASTDDTSKQVGSLSDERIRYLSQSVNKGAMAARNIGISAAHGEWIAFLDSDDLYLPRSLESRLLCASRGNYNVVHSACLCQTSQGADPRPFYVPSVQNDCYLELLRNPGPTFPTLMAKKTSLMEINLLDETLPSYQEWDTSIRLAKSNRFGFIQEPTFIYCLYNPTSISKSARRAADGYHQIVEKHKSEILRHCGKAALGQHFLREALFRVEAEQPNLAWEVYWQGARLAPFSIKTPVYFPFIALRPHFLNSTRSMIGKVKNVFR